MQTTALYLLAAFTLSACKSTNQSEQARSPDATEPSSPAPGDAREATIRAQMQGHERLGDAMRDAVARGDLVEAKGEAKLLTELRIGGPTGGLWKQRLDAMRAAAVQVAGANDLMDASRDVGAVARTCGDCHTLFGRPGVVAGETSAQASGVRAYMQRHQWAAQRLWDGLVVPSDDAWRSGALAVTEDPLAPDQLTPGKSPVPKVGELIQSVHDLGHKALTVDRVDARAALYGEMLATCAACHQWLGGGPTPGGSP
jgi:hypothetical protein